MTSDHAKLTIAALVEVTRADVVAANVLVLGPDNPSDAIRALSARLALASPRGNSCTPG